MSMCSTNENQGHLRPNAASDTFIIHHLTIDVVLFLSTMFGEILGSSHPNVT